MSVTQIRRHFLVQAAFLIERCLVPHPRTVRPRLGPLPCEEVSAPANKPIVCSLESTLQAQHGACREQARTAGPHQWSCNFAANVITQ